MSLHRLISGSVWLFMEARQNSSRCQTACRYWCCLATYCRGSTFTLLSLLATFSFVFCFTLSTRLCSGLCAPSCLSLRSSSGISLPTPSLTICTGQRSVRPSVIITPRESLLSFIFIHFSLATGMTGAHACTGARCSRCILKTTHKNTSGTALVSEILCGKMVQKFLCELLIHERIIKHHETTSTDELTYLKWTQTGFSGLRCSVTSEPGRNNAVMTLILSINAGLTSTLDSHGLASLRGLWAAPTSGRAVR